MSPTGIKPGSAKRAATTSPIEENAWWERGKARKGNLFWRQERMKKYGKSSIRGGPRRIVVASKPNHTTTAGYAGPIARKRKYTRKRAPTGKRRSVKRFKRSAVKGENYFAKRGALSTLEVSGTVTDPNCVYVGHSSLVPMECFRNFMYALIRRVYKEAIGYEASNIKSVIPYRTVAGAQVSSGHSIIVKYVSDLTTNARDQQVMNITNPAYTIENVGNDSFDLFAQISGASDVWKNRRLLYIMCVDDTTGLCRCQLDLQTLKVELYSRSELKIQNVTVPSATDTTEDAVTNVPLVGRSYHLTHWNPAIADEESNQLVAGNQESGVITYRAGANSGQQYEAWREPPPSCAFTNCNGMTKVRMEPGHIRNHVSVTRKTMLLELYLQSLARRGSGDTNRNCKLGTHDMIALERLLQLEGGLPIKLIYECNFTTGVAVVPKFTTPMMQKFATRTQNSIP